MACGCHDEPSLQFCSARVFGTCAGNGDCLCNRTQDPRGGPTLLVLAPTRELAVQIEEEADKFGRTSGIRNTCVLLPYRPAPPLPTSQVLCSPCLPPLHSQRRVLTATAC